MRLEVWVYGYMGIWVRCMGYMGIWVYGYEGMWVCGHVYVLYYLPSDV
jgi:hypothetical protein